MDFKKIQKCSSNYRFCKRYLKIIEAFVFNQLAMTIGWNTCTKKWKGEKHLISQLLLTWIIKVTNERLSRLFELFEWTDNIYKKHTVKFLYQWKLNLW